MDGEGRAGILAWLVDLAAAAIAGGAVGLCLTLLGKPMAGFPAGAGMFLLTFSVLQSISPGAPRFALPALDLPDWRDALQHELVADEQGPVLQSEPVPVPVQNDGVIRLFPIAPLPTAGELKRRIDAHLARREVEDDEDNVVLLSADASAALRSALAELRRSVR